MNTRNFGKKISSLRKAKNMTQSQLAEKLNVSNKAVSRWETGEGYPEVTLLKPLAQALNTTVDELLSESSEPDDDEEQKSRSKVYLNFKPAHQYKYEEIAVNWSALGKAFKSMFKASKILPLIILVAMAVIVILAPVNEKFNSYRDTLITALVAAILVYLAVRLLLWARNLKKGYMYQFWQSLTIFNKVAFGSILVNVIFIFGALISAWFLVPFSWTALGMLLPSVICYIGMIAAAVGVITSLADWYKRQLKGSAILFGICFVARYILPLLSMAMYMPVFL